MKTKIIKINMLKVKDLIKSEALKSKMENAGWCFVETIQTETNTFESKYIKE